MSNTRMVHLKELQSIIEEISRAIMWVNDREEEELMFDWGDKNIDTYIPQKQESYSVRHKRTRIGIAASYRYVYVHISDDVTFFQKLMCNLEEKEKDLNKLKSKVDNLLRSQHPASDKIQVSNLTTVILPAQIQ